MNFVLARQKHDVWIAAVLEPCSTSALVELTCNCLPNLIQKFDSDAVLLSNLIPEFSSARQKHDVWTGPFLNYAKTFEISLNRITSSRNGRENRFVIYTIVFCKLLIHGKLRKYILTVFIWNLQWFILVSDNHLNFCQPLTVGEHLWTIKFSTSFDTISPLRQ